MLSAFCIPFLAIHFTQLVIKIEVHAKPDQLNFLIHIQSQSFQNFKL